MGIDHDDAFKRRKIKLPSRCSQSNREKTARAFFGQHSVGPSINLWIYRRYFMRRQVVKVRLFYSDDTAVSAQPQVSVVVFQDLRNGIIQQTLPHRISRDSAAFQAT